MRRQPQPAPAILSDHQTRRRSLRRHRLRHPMEPQANDFRRMSVEEFDTTRLLSHASKQARKRGYDKFPIVDVDSHHYENESMSEILEYMDDPVMRQLALSGSKPNAKNARILNPMVGYQDMGGRIPRYGLRNLET